MTIPNKLIFGVLCALAASPAPAQKDKVDWVKQKPVPQWIWRDSDDASDGPFYFRKSFQIKGKIRSAQLYAVCDNALVLWINGKKVGGSTDWNRPLILDAKKFLKEGNNAVAIDGQNAGGPAALTFKLSINADDKASAMHIITDDSWKMTEKKPDSQWVAADFEDASWSGKIKELGNLGVQPWGVPDGGNGRGNGGGGSVTDPSELSVAEGFEVDLIYNVPKGEQGSWVALTTGPDGSLLACDQGGKGLFRIDVTEGEDGPHPKVTPMPVRDGSQILSGAQGLLWAFDSLWFHKNGGHLYRCTDSTGDGTLDHVQVVPSGRGGGEHGNHAVILTEDGSGIYMDGGNHAPLHDLAAKRVQSWQEDLLLGRMWDANGHARGKLAPGGWVTRLDPKTLQQELICIGFRNQYDITLNRFGDMFTYDADMEWDMGSPWYRPTRICQVVSGADYGWRSGTGKWPSYYEDSLPPVVDIGPGSPTGVVAGLGTKFPAKYQDAVYALDWTFGTIYAIHMTPQGAGYTGTSEPFVTGVPLPVTDAIVRNDGHLYFTVGGRGTQSGLYRVRYVGSESTAAIGNDGLPAEVVEARAARKQLEAFHGKENPGAVDRAWPYLSSPDRFLRAAARVAIESQPVDSWASRAIRESDPQAKITAAVALARSGAPSHQEALVRGLNSLDLATLSKPQTLGLLRAYALAFIRLGGPSAQQRDATIAALDPHLPSSDAEINTELVRVLVYLRSKGIVQKTMDLIRGRGEPEIPDWSQIAARNAGYGGTVKRILENTPPMREIGYALMLREVRRGWTLKDRRDYFEFLNEAAKRSGGASFPGFLKNIRSEALDNATNKERSAVADITGEKFDPVPHFDINPIQGPGKKWTLETALSEAGVGFKDASFESGRSLYFAADCGKCHRFAGLGGNVGPDLTSIRNKFDLKYLVEHLLEPSKVVSDQYQASILLTIDGQTLTGLISEQGDQVVIYPSDAKADPITIDADDVDVVKPSPNSQMPAGLVDGLSAEELRDLLAYLMSGGNPNDARTYGKR